MKTIAKKVAALVPGDVFVPNAKHKDVYVVIAAAPSPQVPGMTVVTARFNSRKPENLNVPSRSSVRVVISWEDEE